MFRRDLYTEEAVFTEYYTSGYNFKSQISLGQCSLVGVTDYPFGVDLDNGVMKTEEALFYFGSSYNPVYNGVRRARGISCDVYSLTVNLNSNGSSTTMNVFWYFSTSGWDNNDGLNSNIPVRGVFRGINTDINGINTTINQIIEIRNYFNFLPDSVFNIPSSITCDPLETTFYLFALITLDMDPVDYFEPSFISDLAQQLGIDSSSIDILDKLKEYINGWNTVLIVLFHVHTQDDFNNLNQSLTDLMPHPLPVTIGATSLIRLELTTTLACSDDCLGRCHFGTCACDVGWTGTNCEKKLLIGQSDIVINMQFDNFAGVTFIIGFCFFFIGVMIGYTVFKWRYKQSHN